MQRDPYKYFRIEAKELLEGLESGILELERGGASAEVVPRLLRFAHTLKGAARVVKQPGIAELAHKLEDGLAPHRDGTRVSPDAARAAARLVGEASAKLETLGKEAPASTVAPVQVASAAPLAQVAVPAAPAVTKANIAETVRVEIAEMDAVLDSLSEVSVQVGGLRQLFGAFATAQRLSRTLTDQLTLRRAVERDPATFEQRLGRARSTLDELTAALDKSQRHLGGVFERLERELGQVRDQASQLRLLPAHTLFAPLERAAHDAATALGRAVTFEARGGETRLEAHVLAVMRNALLHVVRNAVAHGVESAEERKLLGKAAAGRIELSVERRGDDVVFTCRDDGRGLDLDSVRRVAVERRLVDGGEIARLSDAEVARLIFRPGFTTARAVDAVSGRGVGLDVVQETVTELRGEVAVRTERARGTMFELRVPISLSSLRALAVVHDGRRVWIPLEAVAHTQRSSATEIARQESGDALVYQGEAIPFVTLDSLLPTRAGRAARQKAWSTVIVEVDGHTAALGVDKLLDVSTIIVRALPRTAAPSPLVIGAAFDGDGTPQLVLEPAALIRRSVEARGHVQQGTPQAERLPVLVIDDSLTTRMLEKSILESAGYKVDLAVSAEDGLKKAAERRYGLFLCDVEMPGMNGFEFVARTKADPTLRDVPSILVTSLSSPEDRRRGMEVGAYAYMAKGEYDEGLLRQLIQTLLG